MQWLLAEVRAELGEEAYAAAWQAGRALSLDEAIAEAEGMLADLGLAPPAPEPGAAWSSGSSAASPPAR